MFLTVFPEVVSTTSNTYGVLNFDTPLMLFGIRPTVLTASVPPRSGICRKGLSDRRRKTFGSKFVRIFQTTERRKKEAQREGEREREDKKKKVERKSVSKGRRGSNYFFFSPNIFHFFSPFFLHHHHKPNNKTTTTTTTTTTQRTHFACLL